MLAETPQTLPLGHRGAFRDATESNLKYVRLLSVDSIMTNRPGRLRRELEEALP